MRPYLLVIIVALLAVLVLSRDAPTPTVRMQATVQPPYLFDEAGRITIGQNCPDTVQAGTPVCRDGKLIGTYIDDTTPHIRYWIRLALTEFPHGLVIAAAPMGDPFPHYPRGVLKAVEWYEWCSGFPKSAWGPMPRARAYILQYHYTGFRACQNAPTRRFVRHELYEARKFRPRLILMY